MASVLEQLPEDYVLGRDRDGEWFVAEVRPGDEGDWVDRVAAGVTPEAAVLDALRCLEGKCESWKPRAPGTASAFLPEIWGAQALKALESASAIQRLVNHSWGAEPGHIITFPKIEPLGR